MDGNGEGADVVGVRRNVVGEAAVRPRVAVRGLLPQQVETETILEDDVVAGRTRRPVAVDPPRLERAVADDLVQ